MMKMKRWIAVGLAFILCFPPITAASAAAFTDISGHWAEKEITALSHAQKIWGYEDGSFRADGLVTRGELAAFLIRYHDKAAIEETASNYTDVPESHWAAGGIAAATKLGLLRGYDGGEFRSQAPVSRAEAAAVFSRVFTLEAADASRTFQDVPLSHWASRSIMDGAESGLLRGNPNGTFDPDRPLTRAELAVVMYRAVQSDLPYAWEPKEPDEPTEPVDPAPAPARPGSGSGSFAPKDTRAPGEVTNLTTGHTLTSVSMAWVNPSDADFHEVRILRDGIAVATTQDVSSWYENGLEPEKAYEYTLRTVDKKGNVSSGISVSITTSAAAPKADTTPPTVVTGMSVETVNANTVQLSWDHAMDPLVKGELTSGIEGYRILNNDTLLTMVTEATYTVTNLEHEAVYSFRIQAVDKAGNAGGASAAISTQASVYDLELKRWGISNDATNAAQTTKGFNDALVWAKENGFTIFKVPAGTYLIGKPVKNGWRTDQYITMVGNMTFWADPNAVFQKETNDSEGYIAMLVPYGADHVTIRGGMFRGDKAIHDYSTPDQYGPGTHEGGYGILVQGAKHVSIQSVISRDFTGDGLAVGGKQTLIQDLYPGSFESGAINDQGGKVADSTRIRTKNPVTLDPLKKPMFATEKYFDIANAQSLPRVVDLYYYKKDGAFLQKSTGVTLREVQQIPEGADHMYLVYLKSSTANVYVEVWNRVQSDNVVVRDSEFAYNRRQGITVSGGNNVRIENNRIHGMSGAAPMSGIDVEGGYGENGMLNSNITIRGNHLYNNARYDIILYDGRDALVENNVLESVGSGLAVSEPFTGAIIRGNTFRRAGLFVAHDALIENNTMENATVALQGPNVTVDGMQMVDSTLTATSEVPFGIQVMNVTMTNTKTRQSGISLYGEPIYMKDITMTGESQMRNLFGDVKDGSIFENLTITDYNQQLGIDLPRGTYTNCTFASAAGPSGTIAITRGGTYVLDGCNITVGGRAFMVYGTDVDVTVKNTAIGITGTWGDAFYVESAKRLFLSGNTITASNLLYPVNIIKLFKNGVTVDPASVGEAEIIGNTITTNNASKGIVTNDGGAGAPPFAVKHNVLKGAKLDLKANDITEGNIVE